MNDVYSMFGFMDIIVMACGVYGVYSWYMLVYKHEIKKTFLIGGDTTPEQCKDVEGFASYMGTKLLILSIAMLAFGGLSAYNSYIGDVGPVIWVGLIGFLAIIVWYCVFLRKADGMFFGGNNKKSIKDKALKK